MESDHTWSEDPWARRIADGSKLEYTDFGMYSIAAIWPECSFMTCIDDGEAEGRVCEQSKGEQAGLIPAPVPRSA
jgi:hypothetical protein